MKVRLGDVATYINGYAFKPEDWSDSGLPIIRIQDLTGNSYKTNRFSGKYDKKFEVNDGDILISWSASIGVYVWRGEKAVLNQHIFKVKFDKQVNICKKFFIYQVENILKKAILETHGATMKHLTKPVFDSLPFYLPDIKKQNEISAILDKISEIISLRQRQLKKLDELVKSRFIEMFGDPYFNFRKWNVVLIKDICVLLKSGLSRKLSGVDIGIPVIRSININEGQFDSTDLKYWYICDPQGANIKDYLLNDGDLLINFINSQSQIGKCCIYKDIGRPCIYTTNILRMILKNECNKFYFNYLAQTKFYKQKINIIMQPAVNQASFTTTNFLKIEIPLPPLNLQNEFADFVKQTDKSKLEIQKSLDKLEILKKSLMQQYFG